MIRFAAAGWLALILTLAGPAAASAMTLAAEVSLAGTGFLSFILPRFGLKKGIRVEVRAGDAVFVRGLAETRDADALLIETTQTRALDEAGLGTAHRPAFEDRRDSRSFSVLIVDGAANQAQALTFVLWLDLDVGARTLDAFAGGEPARFAALAQPSRAEAVAVPDGDPAQGERLALLHCGRCHVVNETNRMGGIGSTPSFAATIPPKDLGAALEFR